MKLDLEVMRQAVENFNKEYLNAYISTSLDPEEINEPSSDIPLADKNNVPRYNDEYFDLMVANLLLRECDSDKYPLCFDAVELISRMGYEGLRHCGIMLDDLARKEFCNDIALNKVPKAVRVFDYLLWVEQHAHADMTIWFYYTLLLWILLEERYDKQFVYRSHMLYCLDVTYGFTHVYPRESERYTDALHIQPQLSRLITACCKRGCEEAESESIIPYLLSTLRRFSLVTVSTMLCRSSAFEIFRPLCSVIRSREFNLHRMVVDKSYKNNRQSKGNK